MYGLQYTVPMNAEARILRGVNFGIRERQFIIIVGENGAGKSTRKFADSLFALSHIVDER